MLLKACRNILLAAAPSVLCQQVVFQSPNEYPQPTAELGLQLAPFTQVIGTLLCRAPDSFAFVLNPLRMLPIKINDVEATTDATTGFFTVSGSFTGSSIHLEVIYDGPIATKVNGSTISTRLQIMDELHSTRTASVTVEGNSRDTTLNLGTITLHSVDCEIWRLGVPVLDDYHHLLAASPPAGQLRILRWTDVHIFTEYTYYDYINIRTDWTSEEPRVFDRNTTIFHEFGHTIRHVADGSETHWTCDNFNYDYAQIHDGSEIENPGFAFNEGWGVYWGQARQGFRTRWPVVHDPSYTEWNEDLIANKLLADAELPGSSDAFMVQILIENPKKIHSLYEFEEKLFAGLGRSPPTPTPVCPPTYTDDGYTCRRDVSVVPKPSYGRGVGQVPNQCGAGRELDAGLCYPLCITGYHGVGPVCWGSCPPDYHDDGLTCRRDAKIISSNNSHCPWYDKCGLTFARHCSICPPGYHNDGCTCRIDVSIITKSSYGRGVGTVPHQCAAGLVYDTGLCYVSCRGGFHGVGPVCWGTCPAEYEDHGGTCYRGTSIIINGKGVICL